MHALHVEQYIAFGTPDHPHAHNYNVITGEPQAEQCSHWYISPMQSVFLRSLSEVASDTSREVYFKRAYVSSVITNHTAIPCIVEIIRLYNRVDLDTLETPLSIANGGSVSASRPYISPLTDDKFKKTFKIVKYKRVRLGGGKSISLKTSKKKFDRPITGEFDGSVNFWIRKGNPILWVRVYGTPISFPSSPTGFQGGAYGPYYVTMLNKWYYSHTTMDVSIPQTQMAVFAGSIATIPAVIPGSGVDPSLIRQPLDCNTGYALTAFTTPLKGAQFESVRTETS